MKKMILCIALCLMCLLTAAPACAAEEASILGEWYVMPLSEGCRDDILLTDSGMVRQKTSSIVHFLYDADSSDMSGMMIEQDGVPLFAGNTYYNEQQFFIIRMASQPTDGTTYMFFVSETDADGNAPAPDTVAAYLAPADLMLITPTEMLFRHSRTEYYLINGCLYTIDGNSYVKAPLDWLSEDVFIAHPMDGVSETLMFIRTKD